MRFWSALVHECQRNVGLKLSEVGTDQNLMKEVSVYGQSD
jgi:hypothetical protein